MESQSEYVVSNKPGLTQGLQHEGLREPMGRVIVGLSNTAIFNSFDLKQNHSVASRYLQLSQDVDEDSSVKHWLAVHGGDDVLDLLEGEASQLLHNLGGPLHLLALE